MDSPDVLVTPGTHDTERTQTKRKNTTQHRKLTESATQTPPKSTEIKHPSNKHIISNTKRQCIENNVNIHHINSYLAKRVQNVNVPWVVYK